MAEEQDAVTIVTFNLGNFIDDNEQELEETISNELEDNDLLQLVSNLQKDYSKNIAFEEEIEGENEADKNWHRFTRQI